MASTSTFPSLSVPAPEDSMEVSSPGNHQFDGDIDIDFGDYNDTIHFTDDETMVEDEQTRPGTATDDLMQDDDQAVTAPTAEEIMQDDPVVDINAQQDEDDELIDYDDEEYMDNQPVTIDETFANVDDYAQEPLNEPAEDGATVDAHKIQLSDATSTEGPVEVPAEKVASQESPKQSIIPPAESVSAQGDDYVTAAQESEILEEDEPAVASAEQKIQTTEADDSKATLAEETSEVREADEAEAVKTSPELLDTSAGTGDAGPSTPTDTGLHPMTLQWRGKRMPLFRSRVHTDGLLKDDNLVNVSFADFLSSCKERLSTELEFHFNPGEDLVLRFQALGLTLVEDSPSAFNTSLNDVLELYLLLHRNDSAQEIPPLSIRLSVQPRFSDTVAFLRENADEGSGMSIIDALWVEPEEDNDYSEADAAEQDDVEDDHQPLETDEHANLESGDAYDGGEYYYQPNEDEYNNHEHEDDQDAGVEDKTEAYNDTDVDESHPLADTANDLGASLDSQIDKEQPADEVSPSERASDPLQPGVDLTDSVLTSKDVRVDAANDLAGEYPHDDYIDFDDDDDLIPSSTGSGSALRQDDTSGSTLSSNHTGDDDKTVDQATSNNIPGKSAVPNASDAGNEAQEEFLISDGLYTDDLIDFAEEDLGGEEGQNTEPLDGASGRETVAQATATQADNTNGEASDLQLAGNEEDEQFHTAYDLLDNEDDGLDDADYVHQPKDGSAGLSHVYDPEDVIDFDSDNDDVPAATNHVAAAVDTQARQVSAGSKRSISALEPDVDAADSLAKPDVKKTRAA